MSEPTRVLAEGTLRYRGAPDGSGDVQWMSARVFVIECQPSWTGSGERCTVVAREPMFLPYYRVPAPVGSIHFMPVYDEDEPGDYQGEGDLLMLDVDALAVT